MWPGPGSASSGEAQGLSQEWGSSPKVTPENPQYRPSFWPLSCPHEDSLRQRAPPAAPRQGHGQGQGVGGRSKLCSACVCDPRRVTARLRSPLSPSETGSGRVSSALGPLWSDRWRFPASTSFDFQKSGRGRAPQGLVLGSHRTCAPGSQHQT